MTRYACEWGARGAGSLHLVIALVLSLVDCRVACSESVTSRGYALEVAVAESDAILEAVVTNILDTLVVTQHPGGRRTGSPETWARVRVLSRLKGPATILPGTATDVLVWGMDPALPDIRKAAAERRAGLLFLMAHEPGRFDPDPIASNVPWILVGPRPEGLAQVIWLDANESASARKSVQGILKSQSRGALARAADLVVIGTALKDEKRCAAPLDGVCISISIDSLVVGSVTSDTIPLTINGFGLPRDQAIYFLRRETHGRYSLVGTRAGVIAPEERDPSRRRMWFSQSAMEIRAEREHGR